MKLYEPAPPARKDELTNVQDGIAVIVDGDTCPIVIESGMYAYIKNNTHGLAEGLYKNISDSAFPTSGGTADGTVFEADSTGGLNALNASIYLLIGTYSVSCLAIAGSSWLSFVSFPHADVYTITVNSISIAGNSYNFNRIITQNALGFSVEMTSASSVTDFAVVNITISRN